VSAEDQDDMLAAIGAIRARMRGDAQGVEHLLAGTEPERMVNVARCLAELAASLARLDWAASLDGEYQIALAKRR
jgi:hypothetical protein